VRSKESFKCYKWFDVVAEKEGDANFVEKSAYEPQGGVLEKIQTWLRAAPHVASLFKDIPRGTPVTITL